MRRPREPRDTSWKLLRDVKAWGDRACDETIERGCPAGSNYLNGDSDRHPGDGWAHWEELHRRLKQYLKRSGHGR